MIAEPKGSVLLRTLYFAVRPDSRVLEGGSGGRGLTTEILTQVASVVVAVDPLEPQDFWRGDKYIASFIPYHGALAVSPGTVKFIEAEQWWRSTTEDKDPEFSRPKSSWMCPAYGAKNLIRLHDIDTVVLDINGGEWAVIKSVAQVVGIKVIVARLNPYYAKSNRQCWLLLQYLLERNFTVALTKDPLDGTDVLFAHQ